MRVGVISDTHGVLAPATLELLQGVEQIIHAGDIGKQEIIDRLEQIAPVSAITGNIDWGGPLDRRYKRMLMLTLGGCRIYVTHIGDKPPQLSLRLPQPRPDVVIFGHSHKALLQEYGGVLYLNPGSAGQPRFGGGLSLAILTIEAARPRARIFPLRP